jgi:hypothetical protein
MKINTKIALSGLILFLMTAAGFAIKKSMDGQFSSSDHHKLASAKAQPGLLSKLWLYQDDKLSSSKKPFKFNRLYSAVRYFENKNWIKLGFRDNGQTGWVNRSELDKVLNKRWDQQVKSSSQSVYFDQKTDSNGKPVTHITAYRNGKKLSDQEAKKMVETMQANGRHEALQFERMNRNMQRVFDRDFSMMRAWQPSVVWQFPNLDDAQ